MKQSLAYVALVVRDYDEAVEFFTRKLKFVLVEDTYVPEQDKRWVLVAPPGSDGSSLLLARASTPEQARFIGNQTGRRVTFFLRTDDFWRDYNDMLSAGITFVRAPKVESYGTVAVFEDLYGNRWDLLGPSPQGAVDPVREESIGMRRNLSSGSPYEAQIGFSRAVRLGPLLAVAGTAPIAPEGGVAAPGDVYGQTRRCLEIIGQVIADAGLTLDSVIRTRVMLKDVSHWAEAARAHGDVFGSIRPASTFVEVSGFIDPAWLVEIEADCVVVENLEGESA